MRRFEPDNLRRQRLGPSLQRRRLVRQITVARVHLGDPPRRLARAAAPAFGLCRHRGETFARRAHIAVEPGALGARGRDRTAPRIGFTRQRLHPAARRAAIGERGLRRRRACDFGRGLVLFGNGALLTRGKIGALRLDPLDRGGRAVLGSRRLACGSFGLFQRPPRRQRRRARGGDRRVDPREFAVRRRHCIDRCRPRRLDRAQPVDPFEPLGRRRPARFGNIAVPAAQHARHRHQPLPDRERDTLIRIAHENLCEPPRERRGCCDVARKRNRAIGRGRIARRNIRPRPKALARRIEPRLQIVAERRRQGALIAGIGPELIEQPFAPVAPRCLGQCHRFAVERRQIGMRRRPRRLRAVTLIDAPAFVRIGTRQRRARILDFAQRLRPRCCGCCALGQQRCRIPQRCDLRRHARQIARAALRPHACRRQRRLGHARIGRLGCLEPKRLRQRHLGIAPGALGRVQPRLQFGHARDGFGEPRLDRLGLLGQPRNRLGGIAGERPLARAIFGQPQPRRRHFAHAPRRRRLFGAQAAEPMPRLARRFAQPLRGLARLGRGFARRQTMRRRRALRLGRRADSRLALRRRRLGGIRRILRIAPAREDQPRFRYPNLLGQRTIALGLPRLPPQRIGARILIGNQLVEAGEIDLGRAQFLLGITAAYVEARNPGGFLEHRAAFGRFGGDDRADPPLADQSGRMRTRRRIGEQQRHILGAHIAPVDPVGRARPALDPADDLAFFARRLDQHRDFGEIARGPRVGTREDDIVHARAAHRLGRRLPHRPAQRFEQIGLAAAIGPDDPGQPGLDPQVSRVDEALEPRQSQPLDLHASGPPPGFPAQPPERLSTESSCGHAAPVGLNTTGVPLRMKVGVLATL